MVDWRQFLRSDPQVCHGQLCAKGTRVFVTIILDSLAEGASKARPCITTACCSSHRA
jgi:uncharacterized protein (DUF433 family)